MDLEDVCAALQIGQAKLNLAVKTARAEQCGVQRVGPVASGVDWREKSSWPARNTKVEEWTPLTGLWPLGP